jgi:hypothetical protein
MKADATVLAELGARAYGGCMLVFFACVWLAALAFVVIGYAGLPAWWMICWMAAATLTVAFIGGKVLPLVLRGGTYRVVLEEERLRVESPHHILGPSFAVALAEITVLVVQMSNDFPDTYEIHTRSGEKFRLQDSVGGEAFNALQVLHPEIPIERRG